MSKLSSNSKSIANFDKAREDIKRAATMSKQPLNTKIKKSQSEFWVKDLQKESIHNDNYIITNLVAELAIMLNEKIRLEGENAVFKIENEDYEKKYKELEANSKSEKGVLNNRIKSLEESMNHFESKLKQKDIDTLEEVKKHLSEINSLKDQYYCLKETSDNSTFDFKKLISDLEKEMENINIYNTELMHELKLYKARNQKYKEKLKLSSDVITKLNNMLVVIMNKSVANKRIQTDDANCNSPDNADFQHESIVSELFFKHNPSDLVDSVFFKKSSDLNNSI